MREARKSCSLLCPTDDFNRPIMSKDKQTGYRALYAVVVIVLLLFVFVQKSHGQDVTRGSNVATSSAKLIGLVLEKPKPKPPVVVTKQEPAKVESPQLNKPVVVKQVPKPQPELPRPHDDWLSQAGISASDFGYADFIIAHEGHYDPCVRFGGVSDCSYRGAAAYGVCQSKPGNKMASAGADWATNPITQLRWCNQYAIERYGGWLGAYNYWQRNWVW